MTAGFGTRLANGRMYYLDPVSKFDLRYLEQIEHKSIVKTTCECNDADYKTASVLGTPPIPKDTELVVENVFVNFYGNYIETNYGKFHYYLKPDCLEFVRVDRFLNGKKLKGE